MGSKNKMITGTHMLQVEQINTGNPSLFGIFFVFLWLLFQTFHPWGFTTYWHWYPRANRMRSNFKWTACHLTVPLGNLSRALFKLFVVRNMWGLQSIKISLWRVYTQPYRRSCSQNTLTLTFRKMLESPRGFLKWEWAAMSASHWMWHRAELRDRFQVGKHMASQLLAWWSRGSFLLHVSAPHLPLQLGVSPLPIVHSHPIQLLQRHSPVPCGRVAHFSILLHWIGSSESKINSTTQRAKCYHWN